MTDVLESCKAAADHIDLSARATVNAEALARLVGEVAAARAAADEVFEDGTPVLPLAFSSQDDAINFTCTAALLSAGSGFEPVLGSSVGDAVLRGLLMCHITGKPLTAAYLASISEGVIAELCDFEIRCEVEIMPAVRELRPNALAPLAGMLAGLCRDTGRALRQAGHADFAAFIRSAAAARGYHDAEGRPSAPRFAALLATELPGFRDACTLPSAAPQAGASASASASGGAGAGAGEASAAPPSSASGRTVWFLTKAQLCARDCAARFAAAEPALFGWADAAALTVLADAELPWLLRRAGVLQLPACVSADVDAGTALQSGSGAEVSMRAATVVAAQAVVDGVNAALASSSSGSSSSGSGGDGDGGSSRRITAVQLDAYLRRRRGGGGGGEGAAAQGQEQQQFRKHVTTDTAMY